MPASRRGLIYLTNYIVATRCIPLVTVCRHRRAGEMLVALTDTLNGIKTGQGQPTLPAEHQALI
jgi:hypothetical protein